MVPPPAAAIAPATRSAAAAGTNVTTFQASAESFGPNRGRCDQSHGVGQRLGYTTRCRIEVGVDHRQGGPLPYQRYARPAGDRPAMSRVVGRKSNGW